MSPAEYLDGDGDLDMAVANASGDEVSVLRNTRNGTFAPRADHAAGRGPRSVALGDVDGDGDLDMAVLNDADNDVSVLLNGCDNVAPACPADFNNDGVTNGVDASDFLNAWFGDQAGGTLTADFNADGVSNAVDVSDYFNQWFVDQAGGACAG